MRQDRRTRTRLDNAALIAIVAALIATHPRAALAACLGENTASVICDATNQATAGTLNTTFAGTTLVNIKDGGKIDTSGASGTVTAAGSLTFLNNDTTFGITSSTLNNAVQLTNNFGEITYRGNGTVTASGAANAGIVASSSAPADIDITHSVVTATFGGILVTQSSTGSVSVTGRGSINGGQSHGVAVTVSGLGPAAGIGIRITGSDGDVSGGGTGDGILGQITSASNVSDILIGRLRSNVTSANGIGIHAITAGLGNIEIFHTGAVNGGTAGVVAMNSNTSGATTFGRIEMSIIGNVTGGSAGGVVAQITGASNVGSVLVSQNGNIQSSGPGILATTAGSGSVSVDGGGDISSSGSIGISANSAGGGVSVARNGVVSGTTGIAASTFGGAAVVNVLGNVTGTAGDGVQARSLAGAASVTVTAGTIQATGTGIDATSQTGTVVNMTGGSVGAQDVGIRARSTAGDVNVTATSVAAGSNGILATGALSGVGQQNITVTANGSVSAPLGSGISARLPSSTATGNVVVTQNGPVSAVGTGIGATTLGSGTVTVVSNAPITAGTIGIDTLGIASVTNNSAISGVIGVRMSGLVNTLDNKGSITGTGGTAVQFIGLDGVLIMDGPGAALVGKAAGTGGLSGSLIRFAGSGTNTFNLNQIDSGFRLLDKTGDSTWTLTGSAFLRQATVSAGTLLVNGSLGAVNGLTVAAGATLGGSGSVPSTLINGTLSPGNSIGTITVNGNLFFAGPGNYLVEVAPAAADRTNVTGTATLAGTMTLVATGGTYRPGQYVLLHADSGLSGSFATNDTTGLFGPFLRAHVSYGANDVLLSLDPTALSPFLAPNTTANQRAVAAAADAAVAAGSSSPVVLALFGLTPAQLPGALNAVSGEVHASTAGALADESLYLRSAVMGRLRQASYGDDARMAALSAGGPVAFAGDEELTALGYAKSPIVTKAPPIASARGPDIVFWSQGFGAWGRFDADGNAASLSRDLAGFFTGVDARFGNWRGGVAAGFTSSRLATDGLGNANVESGHVALYGGTNIGAFNLRAGASFSGHSINTDRSIIFPGFFDRATAGYQGSTTQIFGEAGYGFAFGAIAVEPFAGAAWVHLRTDGTTERGGAAALNVAGTMLDVGYSTLGIRAASLIPLASDMVLVPRASAAWQHAYNNVTPAEALAFPVPGMPFTISGVPIARDALLAEAGLDLAIGRHATLGIAYTGQLANNVQDHAAKGKFSWKW